MAISVDPDQTAPKGPVCSGPTLFASILNLSVMLGSFFQQTTSADDLFQMHFFSWRFKGSFYQNLSRNKEVTVKTLYIDTLYTSKIKFFTMSKVLA